MQSLKAKGKEEDERLMEQLDNDFVSLAESKALLSLTQPTKVTALKALLNIGNKEKSISNKPSVVNENIISKVDLHSFIFLAYLFHIFDYFPISLKEKNVVFKPLSGSILFYS